MKWLTKSCTATATEGRVIYSAAEHDEEKVQSYPATNVKVKMMLKETAVVEKKSDITAIEKC